ncbi:LysR family transcriptional regulator [uncultured Bacteroides sp.]|uniref:winged helix-turn-helix domain-containing protein n=1 Tax=uncultured Bacteroides sp. TaxID=162156 RepID=UPI002AA60BA5|nr:LysR family transcriptional regulator [uncultured Bacteroides sp.]
MARKQLFDIKGAFAIYKEDELFLGHTQYILLKALISEGSINAAAKKCKISYQQAWTLADRMNRLSPIPILIRQKGGKDGGGCKVGAYGEELIRLYERKMQQFSEEMMLLNQDLDSCLL